jgi:predicted nucleic acid-binding protein
MSFYLPEFALEEIETKKEKISKLSGLSHDEIDILLDLMLDNISIVSAKMIEPHLEEADKPCCCIKVWLNQLHTTIKRRFPLL